MIEKQSIKSLEESMQENEEELQLTQKNKLLVCRKCGKPIDQLLNNGNYICRECFKKLRREYYQNNKKKFTRYNIDVSRIQKEKIKQIYDGLYLYMIINNQTTENMYIGSSTNIYNRHDKHFNSSDGTAFARYRVKNNLPKSLFTMYVLDISNYKDSVSDEDLLMLEHFNIASERQLQQNANSITLLNDKMLYFDFTDDEIKRLEYLHELIDMSNYIPYEEVKKNKLS